VVTLLYFARLREAFGISSEEAALPGEVLDVAGLTEWLRCRGGVWAEELAPGKLFRVAVNQDMANGDTPISDGDEVAIFPPVTGG
jgi:molybdopterin synthase sulfur carrier subunit